jgi:DNA-binding GntR family transcriptional regulator
MAGIMPKPVPALRPPRGPHEQIAEALIDDIRAGRLQPGDQLPTVVELAVTHTVSVGTAHRAMALLRAQGSSTLGADVAPSARLRTGF